MSLLLAILGLGFLIIVHEAGHLVVARWSKMRVERFSIGFGPPLVRWKPGETQFQIAPIPFGGFVQITGMNPHEDYDASDPHVYPNRPTWQRFLTILAGPATNYIAAIFLIFAVYAAVGLETDKAWYLVNDVVAGKPAEGKLQPGDRIVAVNGEEVFLQEKREGERGDFLAAIQRADGQPVTITALRAGQRLDVQVTPKLEPPDRPGDKPAYRIGIRLEFDKVRRPVGVAAAAAHAGYYPVEKSEEILVGLYKIVTRQVPGDVMGPIGITAAIREHVRHGWVRAFEVLALLSVYLGLFNLLPLPALDGGRLAFLGYELATRRRPNPRVETVVHTVGFVALSLLMILVVFKDIKRLFS